MKQIHTWALILCVRCCTQFVMGSWTLSPTARRGRVTTAPDPRLKGDTRAAGHGAVSADPRIPSWPSTIGECDLGVTSFPVNNGLLTLNNNRAVSWENMKQGPTCRAIWEPSNIHALPLSRARVVALCQKLSRMRTSPEPSLFAHVMSTQVRIQTGCGGTIASP